MGSGHEARFLFAVETLGRAFGYVEFTILVPEIRRKNHSFGIDRIDSC